MATFPLPQNPRLFLELIVIDVWAWDVHFLCNVNFHKAIFIESFVVWDIREMTNNQEMVELLAPKGVGNGTDSLHVPSLYLSRCPYSHPC